MSGDIAPTSVIDRVQRALKDRLTIATRQLGDHPSSDTLREFQLALEEWEHHDQAISYGLALLKEIRDLDHGIVPNLFFLDHSKSNLADDGVDSQTLAPAPGTDWEPGHTAHVHRVGVHVWGGNLFNHTWDSVEEFQLENNVGAGESRWYHVVRSEPYWYAGATRYELFYNVDIFPPLRFTPGEGMKSTLTNYSGETVSVWANWHYFTVVEKW